MVRAGLIEPSRYVALHRVLGLDGISLEGEQLVLGASTTLREISIDQHIRNVAPSLADAASKVGNPRVRSVATLGGAICHGDPRQDIPPVLLSLGASLRVASANSTREIAIADFYTGFMESLLADDELLIAVVVPIDVARRLHYERFTPNSADDYPTVAVALAVELDSEGLIASSRIAFGGVDATAVLAPEVEAVLNGGALDADQIRKAAALASESCDPTSDNRGSAAYKRAMIGIVLERSLFSIMD
jgi:CO/xanthine dehydrogenase FAD-binding subunit